jgi:protoheme IX farnesyltransferase
MKYSLSSSFARLTLGSFFSILALSLAGRAASAYGPASVCRVWPLCVLPELSGWLNLIHILLAGVAGLLVTVMLIKAWRELRDEPVLLPLATVTGVLFFGQAFVGAIQVLRGFPEHLVVLHAVSAVSLWISLVALVATSGLLAADVKKVPYVAGGRRVSDFLALSKPLIVALLLVTTFGGLVAGGRAWPAPALALWTVVGGALAAGGSSALNQYIDRELDRKMQRTEQRPLAAGRLTPAEGLSYGLALCLASYYILAGFVNFTAALLSLAGILYYVVLYSLVLKKATVQNIVIGGGAGAIPPMVGWAAAAGHLSPAAWILFLIIFMWTPPHFWALAIVRAKDYERAGVPMLPVVKGEQAARAQIMIYTVLLVGASLLLPIIGATGTVYMVAASLLGISLLVAAWRVWKRPGNKVAWTMYRWSSMYLLFIFVALMIDAVV